MWQTEDQFSFFEGVFFQTFGFDVQIKNYQLIGGGNINTAVRVETSAGTYFVKFNSTHYEGMFEAEEKGLKLLAETKSIRVPKVLQWGNVEGKDFLVLEFIESTRPKLNYWESLGEQLAELHKHSNQIFGLNHSNYIGKIEQQNDFRTDWISFFIEKRLQPQAGLAYYNGLISKELYKRFEGLYKHLPNLLPTEKPALVHGDLWSGNVMIDEIGSPCLVDPAVHFGNREAELAFTTLFGGFDTKFYNRYDEVFPLVPGIEDRFLLYNVYPLMVHVNIFGTSYLAPVERLLKRF
jgi:protein-ribulosamine 3-kinase